MVTPNTDLKSIYFEISADGRIVFRYQPQSQDTLRATMFDITLDTNGNLSLIT